MSTTQLSSILQAEYRLPVYRAQSHAAIYAILSSDASPMDLEITFRERWTGQAPTGPIHVHIIPGENIITIDIRNWSNGEYRTSLQAIDINDITGELARLLRLDRIAPAQPPKSFGDMTGKRMYFPDEWYLEQHDGLSFQQFKPEVHLASLGRISGPQAYPKVCSSISITDDGRLALEFQEFDYKWMPCGTKRYAVCAIGKWDWTLADALPANTVATNNSEMCGSYCCNAADANPNWHAGDGANFRFYDAEKDGPVNLRELVVQYTGYRSLDWGIVKPHRQSTWLIWHKDNENLLLQNHPFLQDNISDGEFELLTDSNDNFAGQWLDADGRTFHYVRGHIIKRYAPFIATYDNLWPATRMLTVFSTRNGLDWERHYYALPDEADPPNTQHYGSALFHTPAGNGLMVGFMNPYHAMEQQFGIELTWSWNGIEWKRFPNHSHWIPNGPPGSQTFGDLSIGGNAIEKDGMVVHALHRVEPHPHFAFEINTTAQYGHATGNDLREKYESRGIGVTWPYWQHYGSWDKLADEWNTLVPTVGVVCYRKDGLFGISAGFDGGSFTTRTVTARGRLSANMKVMPGGHAKFTLLDLNGNTIATAEANCDGIAIPLFDNLPQGEFRICAELKNASLFTLHFD